MRATSAPIGTETRRVGDHQYADALSQLAAVLQPDNLVSVERLQPAWCSGYLEDFAVPPELAGVLELKQYLRDNYGGKMFKITVLYPNGAPAWEARIAIDGPPRYEGRPIYRDTWGGDRAPEVRAPKGEPTPAAPAQTTASVFSDLKDVLGFAISFATAGSRDRDDKMVELMRESRAQTKELIEAMLNRDTAREKSGSFTEQLGEFVRASVALDEVKSVLAPEPSGKPETEEGLVDGAMREAMKGYIGKAISGFSQRGAGPIARTRAPAPTHARTPPQVNQAIPDAVVSGQPRRG